MITVTLNGENRTFEKAVPLTELLIQLDLEREIVAIALNDRVVPKSRHAETTIQEADQIEIVHIMGGG